MRDTEKIVIDILKTLVIGSQKKNISLYSDLREDLGIDSMRLISLAMQLEQKAGIDLIATSENYDFTTILTVNDVVSLVNSLDVKNEKYVADKKFF